MQRTLTFLLLLAGASLAHANDGRLTLTLGQTDFTHDLGYRDTTTLEYRARSGDNTFVIEAAHGTRDYGKEGDTFYGQAWTGTFARDWTDAFATRTRFTASSDDPVFANRILEQEVIFNGFDDVSLSVGGRRMHYYDGVKATGWYATAAWSLDQYTLRYRFMHHDIDHARDGNGHLVSVRRADREGAGNWQAWLGRGTSVHDYEWAPLAQIGDYRSIAVRRVQPLTASLSLNLDVDHAHYDRPVASYEGLGARVGLAYAW